MTEAPIRIEVLDLEALRQRHPALWTRTYPGLAMGGRSVASDHSHNGTGAVDTLSRILKTVEAGGAAFGEAAGKSGASNDIGRALPINLLGVAGQTFDMQTALAWTRGESLPGGGIPGVAGPTGIAAPGLGGDLGTGVTAATGALGIWQQGAQGGPLSGTLGGAVTGAEIGGAIGGPAGALFGAIGGGVLGLFGGLFGSSKKPDSQSTVYNAPQDFNLDAYAYYLGQKQPASLQAAHSYTATQDLGTLSPGAPSGSRAVSQPLEIHIHMPNGDEIVQQMDPVATARGASYLNVRLPD